MMKLTTTATGAALLMAICLSACRTPATDEAVPITLEAGGTARLTSATARMDGGDILIAGNLTRRFGRTPTGREAVEIVAVAGCGEVAEIVRTRPRPRLIPITRQGTPGRSKFSARISGHPDIRSLTLRVVDSSAPRTQTEPAL